MKKEILYLENVTKIYKMGQQEVKAVNNITLKVMEGERLSIMGPSGSGKSTLLNLLGLLDRPTSGKIYIENTDTTTLNDDELSYFRGKKIGFIFQNFNLIPSLTALENTIVPLMFYNVPYRQRIERATKILERLGLGDRLNYYPSQLSGGQRQRVAIARALINNPAILLADEPTGNLDSKSGEEVLAIFDELVKEGRTLIVVTHDINVAKKSPRIIKIKDGKIESDNKVRK
ncbi:MAG: ABC transporter ATP-binding protein [Candidatus Micrarchaeota archaeon]|nr:ABC transporter ATP-binding protein [Candidatus Micrarchaeota archaeon]